MLDFEFLSAKAPTTRGHVVYIYRRKSPVLRRRVRERMIELAKNDGFQPKTLESESSGRTFFATSLFGALAIVYDAAEVEARPKWKSVITNLVDSFDLDDTNRILAFIPAGSFATSLPQWNNIESVATLITEPEINNVTLKPALEFLMKDKHKPLFDFARLRGRARAEFQESFKSFVEGRGRSFAELVQVFNDVTLTRIDPATNSFKGLAHEEGLGERRGALSLPDRLSSFLETHDSWAFKDLIRLVDERLNRQRIEVSVLMAQLYRATVALLTKVDDLAFRGDDLLYWAALLIGWEDRVVQGAAPVAFDALLRAYRAAVALPTQRRTLDAFWGVIAQRASICGLDRVGVARARTIDKLSSNLAQAPALPIAPWRDRLRSTLTALCPPCAIDQTEGVE
jgi:hypothetical protein